MRWFALLAVERRPARAASTTPSPAPRPCARRGTPGEAMPPFCPRSPSAVFPRPHGRPPRSNAPRPQESVVEEAIRSRAVVVVAAPWLRLPRLCGLAREAPRSRRARASSRAASKGRPAPEGIRTALLWRSEPGTAASGPPPHATCRSTCVPRSAHAILGRIRSGFPTQQAHSTEHRSRNPVRYGGFRRLNACLWSRRTPAQIRRETAPVGAKHAHRPCARPNRRLGVGGGGALALSIRGSRHRLTRIRRSVHWLNSRRTGTRCGEVALCSPVATVPPSQPHQTVPVDCACWDTETPRKPEYRLRGSSVECG